MFDAHRAKNMGLALLITAAGSSARIENVFAKSPTQTVTITQKDLDNAAYAVSVPNVTRCGNETLTQNLLSQRANKFVVSKDTNQPNTFFIRVSNPWNPINVFSYQIGDTAVKAVNHIQCSIKPADSTLINDVRNGNKTYLATYSGPYPNLMEHHAKLAA